MDLEARNVRLTMEVSRHYGQVEFRAALFQHGVFIGAILHLTTAHSDLFLVWSDTMITVKLFYQFWGEK